MQDYRLPVLLLWVLPRLPAAPVPEALLPLLLCCVPPPLPPWYCEWWLLLWWRE